MVLTGCLKKAVQRLARCFCGVKNLFAGGVKGLPTPNIGINQVAYSRPSRAYDSMSRRANQIGTCLHNWREIWPGRCGLFA
jgi:hypothetical protein